MHEVNEVPQLPNSGIVTLVNWTMMPTGNKYLYLWCANWVVVTDSQFPIKGFHSTERWQLLAIIDGKVAVVIPGCQVKAFAACDVAPTLNDCFAITA
jgi:hypothetical protein